MKRNILYTITLAIILQGCFEKQQIPCVKPEYPEVVKVDRVKEKKEEKLSRQFIQRDLKLTGTLEVDGESRAIISSMTSGTVKDVIAMQGDIVKKGQAIITIESPEIIGLQQEYLEAKYQLACTKKDYERQGLLTLEDASSIKKMEKAQAEFLVMETKVKGLENQLKLLNISPEKCSSSHFISRINCRAPIDGTIYKIFTARGQYVKIGDIVAIIENTSNIELIISLPAEYYNEVSAGMTITFENPVNRHHTYQAAIHQKSARINNKQQFEVIAKFINPDSLLIPGMMVETFIDIADDSVWAIPLDAVLFSDTAAFLYIRNGNYYIKKQVVTGNIDNGFIEIINTGNLRDKFILMEIVDNLNNF